MVRTLFEFVDGGDNEWSIRRYTKTGRIRIEMGGHRTVLARGARYSENHDGSFRVHFTVGDEVVVGVTVEDEETAESIVELFE